MRNIALKKIEIVEIQVLQNELLNFLTYQSYEVQMIDKTDNKFLDCVLITDILQKLYYSFRSKIEKTSKAYATINLSPSEAVILILCCNSTNTIRGDFEKFVLQKTSDLIHWHLMSI
ncbi:hypothetical protein [Flavobacterium sp.]|uniref:hypothetical protein n=1 Tax=Flavobacterium sp. TaxID=239 RepID=UPI002B4B05A1|nr:hypothetical protein [Flavobacterium sp.]HLF51882.1 hypothetical protein [Flavobacterium sp.]